MSNIVTGRQLRAARVLAGLTQKKLAWEIGVSERTVRYWELKDQARPTSTESMLRMIEAALRWHDVVVFASPSPGARLATAQD